MKILVVEADRKVAGFMEEGLKEKSFMVNVAQDGDEALMLGLMSTSTTSSSWTWCCPTGMDSKWRRS